MTTPSKDNAVVTGEDRLVAAWEIASVTASVLIASWVGLAFVGSSKLVAAIPVLMSGVFIAYSIRTRGDSMAELGLRLDNLFRALQALASPVVVFVVGATLAAYLTGSLRTSGWEFRARFFLLPVWAFVQQFVLQSFINRRAQLVCGTGAMSALLTAAAFAAMHLPNPWLSALTFVGGGVCAFAFQRAPNLIAVTLAHSAISLYLNWLIDPRILNSFRVGLKYFGGDLD